MPLPFDVDKMADRDLDVDDFEIGSNQIEPDNLIASQPTLNVPLQSQVLAGGERLELRRYSGGDTLGESVIATIMRDVRSFGHLLMQTVGWKQQEVAERREWDLWGPLIFCLLISLVLCLKSIKKKSQVFSIVFSVVWLGQATITSNIKLLGGSISYLHALSITGYSLFPLLVAGSLGHVVNQRVIRIPIVAVLVAWAIWSARRGLGFAGVRPSRIALAAYPMALFYTCLGWFCVLA